MFCFPCLFGFPAFPILLVVRPRARRHGRPAAGQVPHHVRQARGVGRVSRGGEDQKSGGNKNKWWQYWQAGWATALRETEADAIAHERRWADMCLSSRVDPTLRQQVAEKARRGERRWRTGSRRESIGGDRLGHGTNGTGGARGGPSWGRARIMCCILREQRAGRSLRRSLRPMLRMLRRRGKNRMCSMISSPGRWTQSQAGPPV